MSDSLKPKRTKLSPEEKLLRQVEIEKQKEQKRLLKSAGPTEEEIVRKYAKRVIMNQKYHGRVDAERFKGMAKADSVNKNVWMDVDFFFSVVFQSQKQKVEFLEKLGAQTITENIQNGRAIQIVNGIQLAKHLGINLTVYEHREEYPLADMSVAPFVLDTETFKETEDGEES